VCFQLARRGAPDADHHARIVAGPAQENGEDGGAPKAAVPPDPPAAVEQPVHVKGEERRRDLLAAARHAREPAEGAVAGKELERARHGEARRHDLELGAQPHVSERAARSPRAAAIHHFVAYAGVVASAETTKWIHMPLGACPGTPHASRYFAGVEALNVV
jgi:hypothetical protein